MPSPLPFPRLTKLAGAACAVAVFEYLVHLIGDRLLWLAVPVGVFVLVAYAIRLQTRFPSAEDTVRLQTECGALSRALFRFLADRARADAAAGAQWHRLPRDATARDRERAFQDRSEQILEHWQQTMAIYERDFHAYALRLAEDAGVSRSDRRWCEHPATPRGIREVAQILGYVAGLGGSGVAGGAEPADVPVASPAKVASSERMAAAVGDRGRCLISWEIGWVGVGCGRGAFAVLRVVVAVSWRFELQLEGGWDGACGAPRWLRRVRAVFRGKRHRTSSQFRHTFGSHSSTLRTYVRCTRRDDRPGA